MKFKRPSKLKNKSKPVIYSGSKRFDSSCRNHGGCSWCEHNRKFFDTKVRKAAEQDIEDFFKSNG